MVGDIMSRGGGLVCRNGRKRQTCIVEDERVGEIIAKTVKYS